MMFRYSRTVFGTHERPKECLGMSDWLMTDFEIDIKVCHDAYKTPKGNGLHDTNHKDTKDPLRHTAH
jgi:hypothetical protein